MFVYLSLTLQIHLTNFSYFPYVYSRDEDPDPVGSVDLWAAGSDPDPTFNNGYIKLFSS